MKGPWDRRSSPRVLVGLGETAGFCSQLVEGFRQLGVRADHLDLGPDVLGYTLAPRRRMVRLARRLSILRTGGRGPRIAWRTLHRLVLAYLFIEAALRYDAFVFRAGDSFFALRDLVLLRRLGKRVVVVFFGTDSRPSYMSGAEVKRGIRGHAAARATAAKRAVVQRIEASANTIVCHVLTAQLHSRPCVAFLQIGIPRRVPTTPPRPAANRHGLPVRVLHAPSNRASKGTAAVVRAVERVQRRGINIELNVVSGVSNRDVLDAIDNCDFVVDAIHSDSPMAGFVAEAAARGRPAVIGGYGWDELARFTPQSIMPPSHPVHPDDLDEAIAKLASDLEYRLELGDRARRFVEERWNTSAVAERMLAVLTGSHPASWMFDPHDPVYPYGAGVSLPALRASIRSVLDADGAAGLQVNDKPGLERRLIEIAGGEPPP
jgi:hypothetical protein